LTFVKEQDRQPGLPCVARAIPFIQHREIIIKTRIYVAALLAVVACTAWAATEEPIKPIEPVKQINLALAELGKKLYFDPRLSKSGFISCNSCHNLSMGGTDNIPT
jgi:cytochrome c peroxidase